MKSELRWMILLVFLAVVFINVAGLGRQTPTSTAAVLVRDGLLLKTGPDIFLIEDGHRRHIVNLDAFSGHGFDWGQVQEVDPAVLNGLPEGPPVSVLLKGSGEEVYLLDQGEKRHIQTLEDFEAANFVWDDVRYVSDAELNRLRDGPPVPPLTPVPTPAE